MQSGKRILFTSDAQFSVVPRGENQRATLRGYAMVWGALSDDRGGFKVRLLPGSARFTNPTFALWHHSFRDILSRDDDGSLRITMDDIGTLVEIDMPDTTTGRDVEWLVANKKVRGMSFAMLPGFESFDTEENGEKIVNVKSFECDEVTITVIPAFKQTSIGVAEADGGQLTQKSESIQFDGAETKESSEQMSKHTQYKLDYYSLLLAEFRQQSSAELRRSDVSNPQPTAANAASAKSGAAGSENGTSTNGHQSTEGRVRPAPH